MQRKCPMCGFLSCSRFIQRGDLLQYSGSHGIEWTSLDGGLTWTIRRANGLQKGVQWYPWESPLLLRSLTADMQRKPATSLNGPESQSRLSRRELDKLLEGRDLPE